MKYLRYLPVFVLPILLLSASASAGWAGLIPYETLPGAEASVLYRATVDGIPVFVEKFGDVSCIRFAFTGSVTIRIEVPQPIDACTVSPQSYGIVAAKENGAVSLSLDRPRSLIVQVNKQEKLLILADGPEADAPAPGDASVKSLADYLPGSRDPQVPVTGVFQKAIDEAASARQILYVPNGLYMAAQLRLRSNSRLYLQSGALIRAVSDSSEKNFPQQASPKDSSFIFIGQGKNVRIFGHGVIDGNGAAMRTRDPAARIKLLRMADCSQVELDGICLRDSARWTVHILYSDGVTCRNVKVVNDVREKEGAGDKDEPHKLIVSSSDAFDVDASRDVLIEGAFVYTGDDAFSPKVSNYMGLKRSCEGVVLRGNVIWSLKCALRVGDETLDDISNILFEENEIIQADRFIGIWCGDACHISDIRALDNRAEFIGGDANERFFYFRIKLKSPSSLPGTVDNVLIKGFSSLKRAVQASTIEGYDKSHQITGVKIEDMVVEGKKVAAPSDIPLKFKNAFHDEVSF